MTESSRAEPGSSLVVWGSTGRRLQFSKQDLAMPARVKESPNAGFFEKQWEAVSGFWFNRVLKEATLQHMRVEDIVELIVKDIEKRWQARRAEQAIHKKKKRLLASTADSPAGAPSEAILLTNVCSYDEYETQGTAEWRRDFLAAITNRVEEVAKDAVRAVRVLVDTSGDGGGDGDGDGDGGAQATTTTTTSSPAAPAAKKPRTEARTTEDDGAGDTHGAGTATPPAFDDRVAVVCTLSSTDRAALAIAHLHGSVFDGRVVVCRFWAV